MLKKGFRTGFQAVEPNFKVLSVMKSSCVVVFGNMFFHVEHGVDFYVQISMRSMEHDTEIIPDGPKSVGQTL